MPVSSLVFVVIVAIWAAYLVQHWARRREDAAAARSVEGFSQAMRVLEKRPSLPTTELRTPRPDSYAVRPAVAGRATVDVKRAVPAVTDRRRSPLVARRGNDRVAASARGHHDAGSGQGHGAADIAPHATEGPRMPASARPPSSPPGQSRPERAESAAPAPVPSAHRRIRAVLLLVSVAWLPVSVVLTVTGVLMWVSIPFAVLTVVAVLVWLRAEAQADRLRTSSTGESEGQASGRRSSRHDESHRNHGAWAAAHHLPVVSVEDTQVIGGSFAGGHSEVIAVSRQSQTVVAADRAEPGVFDVQAPLSTRSAAAPLAEPEPVAEGSWSPVPVPRPTYTLKAKAEPRFTESGIPADVFDTPEFAEEAEELDDRALFARRAVSQ